MLTPFRGRPLIASVIDGIARGGLRDRVAVLTSTEPSDDALADYVLRDCGVPVFRGDLDNVVGRFQAALKAYACDWFVRISGDSPLMDGMLVKRMVDFIAPDFDLVTNVKRRTFPPGESVECVRSAAFASLDAASLTPAQREHVTTVFYDEAKWKLRSVVCREPQWATRRLVVDTPDDLRNVEAFAAANAAPSFAQLAEIEV
jgi:spore coat polysaccharide biosynthesis protein SpsF (cytidylyltransferase family)